MSYFKGFVMEIIKSGAVKKIYCKTCKGRTHHELKAIHKRNYQEVEGENTPFPQLVYWEDFEYGFWICKGCDTASLEEKYTNIGMYDKNGDEYFWEETLYPKRDRVDLPIKYFRQLPKKLDKIYGETLQAQNNELPILASIGIRALLEGICADKDIKGGNLKTKIENLSSILPKNIVTNLHTIRFLGNDAAHELAAPRRSEIILAIEICEDLLNFLYELDYKAGRLAKMQENRKIVSTQKESE